ncbi:MAG TPA: gamma-glutamyltransferase [Gammaproteobacteria bacterium]|nr:gamma-glutamyltransferase [Gammaproteobacteria bacterium]
MDSGGSNRIRSALLQVIVYLLDFGLSPGGTIRRPRLH